MRILCRIFVAAVLIFSLPLSSSYAEQIASVDDVLAKVGNMLITRMDVDIRAQKTMPMQVSFHGEVSAQRIAEIKQEALDDLIDRAYKVLYAIDEEISVDAAVFEREWQARLSENKPLAAASQTVQFSKIKAYFYLDLLARRAEEVAVDEKITVSDQDVSSFYEKNKAIYLRPKLFTASHVFVKVDPASNVEERKAKRVRAEALLKRAQSGEDFYDLAYYESDDRTKYVGGSLGSFHAGQTVPEFDAAIQTMKPGDVAGPVRTMYGFHIIKLDALAEKRQLEFDEVAVKIRTNLEKKERDQLYEKWMSELKERYPLERLGQNALD